MYVKILFKQALHNYLYTGEKNSEKMIGWLCVDERSTRILYWPPKLQITRPVSTLLEHNLIYWVVHKLPHIYTANQATFPIQIRKITVQICGNNTLDKNMPLLFQGNLV